MAESNIKNKVLDLLEQVVDPKTQNSIFVEKRLIDVVADNNTSKLVFNGRGLSDDEKINLSDSIKNALKDVYQPNAITVTFDAQESESQGPKVSSVSNSNASLKIGHEQKSSKKKLPNVKRVIAVASGKGGVGKSTFSTNLALSLKETGKKVGIIDADIYGPSLPMLLGKRDAQPKANENKKMLPIDAHGVTFMSFGLFVEEKDPVIWRGPMLGGVINQFLFDTEWGELDYLIIDLPPGTGDIQLSLAQMLEIDGVIIISTPQDVALLDAKKGLNMFRKVNIPIIGMVENMSYFVCDAGKKYHIFGNGGVKEGAKSLETSFLGDVPLEMALRESSDKGHPYMANKDYKDREVWKSFLSIANKLNEILLNEKRGFFTKLFR